MGGTRMTDSFRAQYQKPEDEFDSLFFTMWRMDPHKSKVIDPEVKDMYRRRLGHIRADHLRKCYEEYIDRAERAAMPSIGVLKSIHARRLAVQESKREQKKYVPLPKKERARRKCKSALAQRLCGMTIETKPADGIDATWLASCVEVDLDHRSTLTSTEALRAHDAAVFRALDELFEEEWDDR